MKTFHSSSQHILLVKATTKAEEIAEKGGIIYRILTCTESRFCLNKKANFNTTVLQHNKALKIGAWIFLNTRDTRKNFRYFLHINQPLLLISTTTSIRCVPYFGPTYITVCLQSIAQML